MRKLVGTVISAFNGWTEEMVVEAVVKLLYNYATNESFASKDELEQCTLFCVRALENLSAQRLKPKMNAGLY